MKTRSGIITLTTDFGLIDPYVAMMKGVILSINPKAIIIDITHHIQVGSILTASSLIRETFPFFPQGSIHVGVVDPTVGSQRRLMGIEAGGHFFVGPDNGLFGPIINDHKDARIIKLENKKYFLPHLTYTFHGREVFAPIAAHLSCGVPLDEMGSNILDPVYLYAPLPQKRGDVLYGQVTRVDNFGNIITNISHHDLQLFIGSAEPIIELGHIRITGINRIYSEAESGEVLALIYSSNLLELAVNLGRADKYIGIDPEQLLGAELKIRKKD
jgi:S-adenosylmethionine hydrolase